MSTCSEGTARASAQERILVVLLRLAGAITVLAFLAMFFLLRTLLDPARPLSVLLFFSMPLLQVSFALPALDVPRLDRQVSERIVKPGRPWRRAP